MSTNFSDFKNIYKLPYKILKTFFYHCQLTEHTVEHEKIGGTIDIIEEF